ncbi:hypothetical protein TRFO_29058 [Tritrichomonas foetus]|uniref:Uncharacterized protein n=1 Tax=Tritrichomonas foetus TaxID=1144522 RepID=A0A1J4JYL1_9EUKA|nr:hypothetical protein TRFO_29058 [Tritrichomonas foetus]|eukprot:OHT03560.1 hypothetical protein TRFO_29058 [Tritrichomonas foetus]
MNSSSFESMRRNLRNEEKKDTICLTPELISQIPSLLSHFEVPENESILLQILKSQDDPEQYGIHEYLYQVAFSETDLRKHKAQAFLIESTKTKSFPYLLFSNEESIINLIHNLETNRKCAANLLCSIFDHNTHRNFISISVYETIFSYISEHLDLIPLLVSILLYCDEFPKDIFNIISPIIVNLLNQPELLVAWQAMFILVILVKAEIPFDTRIIIQCEERFINSIDETVIYTLLILMKNAPEAPHACLNRILQFANEDCEKLITESLVILTIFSDSWNDNEKDVIATQMMMLFYESQKPRTMGMSKTILIVGLLFAIDRLPISDLVFFNKVVEMIDVWDNKYVLLAISTMVTKTQNVSPETAAEMIEILRASRSLEDLAQDENQDVSRFAQQIINSILSPETE